MRAFIVLCLCATTLAAPQGYNYQQQTQQQQQKQQSPISFGLSSFNSNTASGNSGSSGSSFNHGSFLQEALKNANLQNSLLGGQNSNGGGHSTQQFSAAPQFNQAIRHQQQQQQPSFGFGNSQQQQQSFLPNFGGPQQQPQYQNYQQQQQFQSPNTVTKDIYVHVAPEDREEQQFQQPLPQAPPRKHYRIVFIKAPSQNINKAALRINQAPTEEKTIIYVLTKKPDPLDLQAAIQEAQPKQPSKPEVYFIKYKTQEEAQHAQRTIQAQYDQLGGTTQISDEGIAPVTSVIGSLDGQQAGGSSVASQQTFSSGSSSSFGSGSGSSSGSSSNASKYLPPIVKF